MNLKTKLIILVDFLLFLSFLSSIYLGKLSPVAQILAASGPAILSLSPNSGNFTKDQTFEINVLLNTGDKPVVAVDVSLTFDSSKLQVQSVTPGSLFQNQIVLKNETSNSKILLSLGSFTPFTGSGTYGTIKFLAAGIGDAQISFDTASSKVTQQGGGNILGNTINSSYKIIDSTITPSPTLSITPGGPTPTPTVIPSTTPIPTPPPHPCQQKAIYGDYDCNDRVDEMDFAAWEKDFLVIKTSFSYFEYWRRSFYK